MANFVDAYQAFYLRIRNSEDYKTADSKQKKEIDAYFLSNEVVEFLLNEYIPKLTLNGAMFLTFLNSKESQKNISKIKDFVNFPLPNNCSCGLGSILSSLPEYRFGR